MNKHREFQIFVKPAGAECNLSCSYCYYLIKKDLYHPNAPILMSDEILETYIKQHIEATTDDIINFSWHGGEPLLAGIEFFRKIVEYQRKFKPAEKSISNGIQTNGTLMNDEWCSFLAAKNFTVGISIDGPAEMHNTYRRSRGNSDTFANVIRGYRLMQSYGIVPEVLCVINSQNVKHPAVLYNFFKQLGVKYLSFLPLVEKQSGSPSGVSMSTVPSEEFGIFLSTIFEEWVEKDIGSIKIQIFEEAARKAFNQDHTLCIFKENCGGVPVIERTGDFYSCDHYVDPDHLIGNILNGSLSVFLDSKKQQDFGRAKSLLLPRYCIDCEVISMCNGECPKNRFINSPEGEPGLNYLCSGYKIFFNHCQPFVDAIRTAWNNP